MAMHRNRKRWEDVARYFDNGHDFLNPRETAVLKYLYGYYGRGPGCPFGDYYTYRAAGDVFGVTMQSIEKIHAKALRKLNWNIAKGIL